MAYYAFINSDNIVVQVITGVDENAVQTDIDGKEVGGNAIAWEVFYTNLLQNKDLRCLRTSYNTYGNVHISNKTPIRGNFASVGGTYDADFDVFISPCPYPSWKLNYETFLWESSVPQPKQTAEHGWRWSEINKEWVKLIY